MQLMLVTADRLARVANWPILLIGESGAGKSILAHWLHRRRRGEAAPFEHVLMHTLSSGLAAAELFGHAAGAFTDARTARRGRLLAAEGGTVFLDEIDKAPMSVLTQLLHVIDRGQLWPVGSDRHVELRADFVAATNRSLALLRTQPDFPQDLLARFGHFILEVPPLRERRADIAELVNAFLERLAPRCGYDRPPTIEPDLLDILREAPWPGNLRELESALAIICAEARGEAPLAPRHLPPELANALGVASRAGPSDSEFRAALERMDRSIPATAQLLGIHRSTAWRRANRLKATQEDDPSAEHNRSA
ncbi:MAG: sigma-54-dependent Fis family transcriptional regulator [Gemmatimonadetes bacterium]|nr:sigma-54-dependent Fis family transcriptional regulator [Gemmatimonadota bacterium]